MAARSRLPVVIGDDGLAEQVQPAGPLYLGAFTVATLPTGSAIKAGSLAYAGNGPALAGVSVLGIGGLLFHPAGQGTGCLVTWSGAAWQVAGTTGTVQA